MNKGVVIVLSKVVFLPHSNTLLNISVEFSNAILAEENLSSPSAIMSIKFPVIYNGENHIPFWAAEPEGTMSYRAERGISEHPNVRPLP